MNPQETLGIVRAPRAGRVLVVDDEFQVRTFFQNVLKDAGYEVLLAEDGRQALKLVRAQAFDLALVDLVMPNMEGLETIKAMRKELPALKVIAVSGFRGGEFLRMARYFGANSTIFKPVDPMKLVSAIGGLLVRAL